RPAPDRLRGRAPGQADLALEPVLRTSPERVTKTRTGICLPSPSLERSDCLSGLFGCPEISGRRLRRCVGVSQEYSPSLDNIGVNLRYQLITTGELSGRADSVDEVKLDLSAVQIAGEAHQVGFDLPGKVAERWIRPDIACGVPRAIDIFDPCKPRVDAFGGDERIDASQIDCGKANRRPSACSLLDRPSDS